MDRTILPRHNLPLLRCACINAKTTTSPTLYYTHKVFDVDADDDIVVGDTIIFTERLYVDMDGDLITGLGASGGTSPPVSYTHLTLPTICSV